MTGSMHAVMIIEERCRQQGIPSSLVFGVLIESLRMFHWVNVQHSIAGKESPYNAHTEIDNIVELALGPKETPVSILATLALQASTNYDMNANNAEVNRKAGGDAGQLDFTAKVYGTLRMILQDAMNDTELGEVKRQVDLKDNRQDEEPA